MDVFPLYRKGTQSGVVVKFIAPKSGYVVKPGSTTYKIGTLHTDWSSYNEYCWEHYNYESTVPKSPDKLELFETTSLNSSTNITKVPNGYVMTSHSGHQILIPSNFI